MPVSYEYEGTILVVRMVGEYVPADIRATLAAALSDPARPVLEGLLFDVSRSTALRERTAREVRAMAALLAHLAPDYGGRLALLAGTDFQFGFMRLGAADVEAAGVDVWTFRDADAALRWLRRDDPGAPDSPDPWPGPAA